jgi:tetratricopeptide (TPR) repeat protein
MQTKPSITIFWLGLFLPAFLMSSFHPATAQEAARIEFPNSGKEAAQPAFIQGVLLLHSFEFEDAAEAFQEAQQQDPDFALAYWGEAMSCNRPIWGSPQLREQALASLKRLAPTPEARQAKAGTEREKGLIRAVEPLYGQDDRKTRDQAYHEVMKQIYAKHPDDAEIGSFYALSYLGLTVDVREPSNYLKAAAIAQKVLDKHPDHPGALHYLIHSYDDPEHAHLALQAAERYPKAAPYASHALHMPSHIFVALGKWNDVVASNEQSVAAGDHRREVKKLPVDQRNFHSLLWLEYGYLQQGRNQDAFRLLEAVAANAAESGSVRTRSHLNAMRAHAVVETRNWNSEALKIPVKVTDMNTDIQNIHHFTDGYAAIMRGDAQQAKQALDAMVAASTPAAASASADEHHHGAENPSATSATKNPISQVLQHDLQALLWLKEGKNAEAEQLLRKATQIEDAMSFMYGPPDIVKPSHELLGEVLLQLKRPMEAKKEFQLAMKRAPNRTLSLIGLMQAAKQSGDQKLAAQTQATLKAIRQKADEGLVGGK